MKNRLQRSAFALALALTLGNSQTTQSHIWPRDEDYDNDYESPRHHGIVGGALIGAGNITKATVNTATGTVDNTVDTATGRRYRARRRRERSLEEENQDLATENQELREQAGE